MTLRVALLQFAPAKDDVAANLARVEAGLREAAARGIEWVGLPEMWATSFVELSDAEALCARSAAAVERVRTLSEELGLVVFGSAFAASPVAGERPRNRLSVFDAGRAALVYDKVHLFTPTGERESFSAGDAPPPTVAIRGARVTGIVCYDLRFGPLLHDAWQAEAEVILAPAQWPAPRAAHWRALVLGRAAEHQAFVLAPNRTGVERLGRRGVELVFAGNSIIAGPDGSALAEGCGEEGLLCADLELSSVGALRRAVPVRRDQRPEIYSRDR